MGYTIEQAYDGNVIWVTYEEGFSIAKQLNAQVNDIMTLFEQVHNPFLYVVDARELKVNGFRDVISSLSEVTRTNGNMFEDPNLVEMVVVTTSSLIKMGASALNQDQYGGSQVTIYPSIEEARHYIEERLAKGF